MKDELTRLDTPDRKSLQETISEEVIERLLKERQSYPVSLKDTPVPPSIDKLIIDTFHELYPYSSGPHLNELQIAMTRAYWAGKSSPVSVDIIPDIIALLERIDEGAAVYIENGQMYKEVYEMLKRLKK